MASQRGAGLYGKCGDVNPLAVSRAVPGIAAVRRPRKQHPSSQRTQVGTTRSQADCNTGRHSQMCICHQTATVSGMKVSSPLCAVCLATC